MLTINDIPTGFGNPEKIIAIDFDGVIHDSYNGYGDGTCYGEPIPGAIDAIIELSENYDIVIFTAKAKPDRPLVNGKTGTELVWEWLKEYNIDMFIAKVTSEKPRAKYYIDDNAIRFETWNQTMKELKNGN